MLFALLLAQQATVSAVEQLTAVSFDKFVAKHENVLVEWACIYEKDHQTDFVTAAGKLQGLVPIGAFVVAPAFYFKRL